MKAYHFFIKGPFSQWHRCRIELDGRKFTSAEQAMMYAKAMLFDDRKTAKAILAAKTPKEQKALGREVKKFDRGEWDRRKYHIVCRVNRAKFLQNDDLRRELFRVGPKLFVEASPSDAIWGVGLNEAEACAMPPEDWPGENLLGRALSFVRDELREEFMDEYKAMNELVGGAAHAT